MPVMILSEKESAFLKCAHMILADQCPPDRKYYLCMVSEDCTGDCTQCWINYLWAIGEGSAELPKEERRW